MIGWGLAAIVAWGSPWLSGLPTFHHATLESTDGEVSLSASEVEWIVHIFRGVPRDRAPMKWQIFGTIRLFGETGKEVSRIEVFTNPGGKGPFRIGNDYFIGYDQAELKRMLDRKADLNRQGILEIAR